MTTDLRSYQPRLERGRLLVPGRGRLPGPVREILAATGLPWDLAATVERARELFFARGGHEALLIPPGTGAAAPREIILSLRHIDPSLPILTFLDPAVLGRSRPAPLLLDPGELQSTAGRRRLLRRLVTTLVGDRGE